MRRCRASLLLLALLLTTSSAAQAYVPSTSTSPAATPLRWTDSNCIVLRINSVGSDDIQDGSDVAAIKSAVQRWHDAIASCSYLRFSLLDDSPTAKAAYDQESTIVWVESGWKSVLEHDPSATALTTVVFIDGGERDGKLIDADMELNGEFFRFSAGAAGVSGKMDVENTVVHELGHVLGLDHPCDDGAYDPAPKDHLGQTLPSCFPAGQLPPALRDTTMYNFAAPAEIKKRTPEADDVLGICQTYPLARDPGVCAPPHGPATGGCATVAAAPLPTALLLGLLVLVLGASGMAAARRRHMHVAKPKRR